ncbi:hypothetical protein F5Y15DRAFT_13570 [Xylariaceae sp. FL0016]|nr:hypothetical protein F5Y15DRAFT_13570 [Xylariaceae sp. FL0016]
MWRTMWMMLASVVVTGELQPTLIDDASCMYIVNCYIDMHRSRLEKPTSRCSLDDRGIASEIASGFSPVAALSGESDSQEAHWSPAREYIFVDMHAINAITADSSYNTLGTQDSRRKRDLEVC